MSLHEGLRIKVLSKLLSEVEMNPSRWTANEST